MPSNHLTAPLSDDDVRWLAVRTAASLSRLWARMQRFAIQPGGDPMRPIDFRKMRPVEPWLEAVPPNTSFDGILLAVQLAQGLLLLEATCSTPPDRRRLCLIVQHVSCSAMHWSAKTLRLAGVLHITLAAQIRDEPSAAAIGRDIYALDGTYAGACSSARTVQDAR